MPELIDRRSLIDKLDQGQKKALDAKDFMSFYALVFFKAMLQEAPTIDAEPVRHGHWIFREEATPEYLPWDMWCSCCGEYHDSDDYNDRYCSKCGAKMDGGADDAAD